MTAELSTGAVDHRRPVLTVVQGGRHSAAMQDHHPRWTDIITAHRAWLTGAMLSRQTINLRCYQLRRLAEAFPAGPWLISADQLAGWIAARGWAAGTIRSFRACFSKFFRWAVKSGRLVDDPTADLPKAPKQRLKPRPAPQRVIDQALAIADERLAIMIRLARQCGMRRGEIAVAHTDDLSLEDDGWWITAHGKGAKVRTIPIPTELVIAIQLWMRNQGGAGWLFAGRVDGHMAPASVGRLISRTLGGRWSAHPLRHRFATDAYAGTQDLAAVQELLGHERVETTRIYVEVDRSALRRAAAYAAA